MHITKLYQDDKHKDRSLTLTHTHAYPWSQVSVPASLVSQLICSTVFKHKFVMNNN